MKTGLQSRRILVTGASGGIGQSLARELAAEGARIGVHYRSQRDAASRLCKELPEQGAADAIGIGADLSDEAQVQSLFDALVTAWGGVDAVVVNAGIWPPDDVPIVDMELAQWRQTLDVNLTGAFLCCRAMLRQARKQEVESPAIVLVGSTAGIFGEPGHGDYSASKAGLEGLLRTLKNEIVRIHPRGRVNLVHPGWVATPMAAAALEDAALVDRVTSTMALRKVATPEDVARAVVFLLSERLSGHLSGVALPVAGGMEGRLLHPP